VRIATCFALAAALSGCGVKPSATQAAKPAPAALRVLPDRVDGRPLLAPTAARAVKAGAGPLAVLGADVVSEGDRIGAFVEIPDGECLLAFVRSSSTIGDVDLFAFDDEGSSFASDESPDADAAIVICPPHPRRLYVVAKVMAGSGILSVGVQPVPRAAEARVAAAVGARGRPGEDTGRLDAWPGLEAKIRAHRQAIGARWEDVRRVAVPLSPRAPTRVSASVDAGRCLDVLVSPSDEIGSLEVVAEDTAGRIIGRARDAGRDRALVMCSATTVPITITVRPRGTQGLAAITMGRSAVGAASEIEGRARVLHVTPTEPLAAARAALARGLSGGGYAAPRAVATGTAKVGARAVVPVDLPQGCARIDVIAGAPLSGLEAVLWDDKGARIAEGRGGAAATLFACGSGGAARLDFEALESPGPFAVELRKDNAAPPALVAHPIAAGRLLARMNAGGDIATSAAATSAKVVALDDARLESGQFVVAPGTCAEVIVALDKGGSGVELRMVDAATRESTLARARHVVSDQLCAASSPRAGSYEIRLAAGKADALVQVRTR